MRAYFQKSHIDLIIRIRWFVPGERSPWQCKEGQVVGTQGATQLQRGRWIKGVDVRCEHEHEQRKVMVSMAVVSEVVVG